MNARAEFGSNLGLLWESDPRMLAIRMARYKFVAKMLAGTNKVLEVGAGDGTLSRIVRQTVHRLSCCDLAPQGPEVIQDDLTIERERGQFDAVYALDVLEHVSVVHEYAFLHNICRALGAYGTCIIGMPSLESQPYASPISQAGHVNCKTEDGLRMLMRRHFHNVYVFGMNDEVVHTGFGAMCHYRICIATGKRGAA